MTTSSVASEIWVGRWKHIRVRQADGVTEMILHSDDGALVWNAAVHRELPEALLAVDADPGSKVLILGGAGDSFCNEIDFPSFYRPDADWVDVWYEGRKMLELLVGLNIPIVSVVNGPARIHAELGVLAEAVLASPDAVFADLAHFTRGATPGDGVHAVWPKLLGPTRGRYFLLTGTDIDAQEALRVGFVHEIHDRAALYDRAWELARTMAQASRATLQYTKMALSLDLRRHFADDLSHGLALQGQGFWARKAAIQPKDD
jgi:enoyl-CoA hydratase/carnithine racemase